MYKFKITFKQMTFNLLVAINSFLGLINPSLHNIVSNLRKMQRTDQCGRTNGGILIDNRLFHVSLDRLQHGHIRDAAQGPNGGRTVHILLSGHVFRQTGRDNDHVVGDGAQFFDAEIHHAAQRWILRLKEFRHRKEGFGGLCSA